MSLRIKGFMPALTKSKKLELTLREKIVLQAIQKLPNPEQFTYGDLFARKPGSEVGIQGGYGMTSLKYAINRLLHSGDVVEMGKKQKVRFFGWAKAEKNEYKAFTNSENRLH